MKNKAPIPIPGYVIYAKIAIDIGEKHELETGKQTELNRAMAAAIRKGQLRTYDIDTGLPLEASEASVYVRAPDVEAWLEKIGYRYVWTGLGSKASEQVQPGKGTNKKWDDKLIEDLIAREAELKKAKVRGWAMQAAKEFGTDQSRVRKLKRDFREKKSKLFDPRSWQAPPTTRDPSRD